MPTQITNTSRRSTVRSLLLTWRSLHIQQRGILDQMAAVEASLADHFDLTNAFVDTFLDLNSSPNANWLNDAINAADV